MLEVFGLTPDEEAIYLALVDMPPMTLAEAHRAGHGLGRDRVRTALERLTDKGFVSQLGKGPRRYTPVAPEVSLEAHLLQQEERLRQGREVVAALSQRFRTAPRQTGVDEFIEIVSGKRRVEERWSSAIRGARREIRTLDRPPFPVATSKPNPTEMEVLPKGVAFRAVYDRSGVRSADIVAKRRAEIAAGEQARMIGEVPVRLMLVDDNLALMPLRHDRPITDGVVVVHACALRDALSVLFEQVWNMALPFTLGEIVGGEVPDAGPALRLDNPTAHTVFNLLAAGLTDAAIARRLDCSERTVHRYVQKIVDATGSKSRFQAALQIGRRGWTDNDDQMGPTTVANTEQSPSNSTPPLG